MVVHGQVHAAAGDAGLVREHGQRGLETGGARDQNGGTVLRPSKFYRMFLDDYERDAIDASPLLHRHERVLGVDAVRVEHVRVAAHRREEHVLQYGRRQ